MSLEPPVHTHGRKSPARGEPVQSRRLGPGTYNQNAFHFVFGADLSARGTIAASTRCQSLLTLTRSKQRICKLKYCPSCCAHTRETHPPQGGILARRRQFRDTTCEYKTGTMRFHKHLQVGRLLQPTALAIRRRTDWLVLQKPSMVLCHAMQICRLAKANSQVAWFTDDATKAHLHVYIHAAAASGSVPTSHGTVVVDKASSLRIEKVEEPCTFPKQTYTHTQTQSAHHPWMKRRKKRRKFVPQFRENAPLMDDAAYASSAQVTTFQSGAG